uniref:Uncharacterized protein n=1 Tax=Romanomermis culicivorax TaxID=13658 RepID=A0A915I492_ROMCU
MQANQMNMPTMESAEIGALDDMGDGVVVVRDGRLGAPQRLRREGSSCLFRRNRTDRQQLETFSLKIHFLSEKIAAILRKTIALSFGYVTSIALCSTPSEKAIDRPLLSPGLLDIADQVKYMTYIVKKLACKRPELLFASCILGVTDKIDAITHKIKLIEIKALCNEQSSACD